MLKYVDPNLLKARPKAFFGYSDTTNLHNFLWNLGLVSYHGGSIMNHFGRSGAMHPHTLEALRRALFEHGDHEIHVASGYTDVDRLRWEKPADLLKQPELFPAPDWRWLNAAQQVEGTLWGGNLEILD